MTAVLPSSRRRWILHPSVPIGVAYALYVLAFAAWILSGWGSPSVQALAGDLAPLPTHLLVLFLLRRLSNRPDLPDQTRRGWRLVTLAFAAYALGDLVWAVIDTITGTPAFPSLASLCYLAFYPLVIAGLLTFPAARMDRSARRWFALDVATVLLAGGLMIWQFVLRPIAGAGTSDIASAQLLLVFPAVDFVLLFGLFWLALRRPPGLDPTALRYFAGSMICLIAADLAFAHLSLADSYRSGGWTDLLWLASRGLAAVAVSIQIRAPLRATLPPETLSSSPVLLTALPFSVIGVAVLLLTTLTHSWTPSHVSFLLGVVVLIVLVSIRQFLVLRHNVALARELRAGDARQRLLVSQLPCTVWTTDRDLRFTSAVGANIAGRFEHSPFAGKHLLDVIPPSADAAVSLRVHQQALRGESGHFIYPDGAAILEIMVEPLRNESGAIIGTIGVSADISERLAAQDALRRSEERFQVVASATNDVIWDWDIPNDAHWFSSGVKTLFGYAPETVSYDLATWYRHIHPEDRQRVIAGFNAALATDATGWSDEYRFLRADGSYTHIADSATIMRDERGAALRMIGGMQDISERKQLESRLRQQAFSDDLTGLPNRACFLDRLSAVTARAGERAAVLFLDLDGFKVVNDSLGHATGDRLLIAVGERFKTHLAAGDTLARFGGDEFAVLLEGVAEPTGALETAGRLLGALAEPFVVENPESGCPRELFVTATFGVALSGDESATPDELLRRADVALYQAKAAGKARAALFDPAMDARAHARLDLEAELRRAIERDELELHFQPEVDLATGAIVGAEALCRWRHPQRGMISPAEFIPVAEETDLIIALDRWVIRESCRRAAVWCAAATPLSPFAISVNVSARHLTDPGLVAYVAAVLAETGVSPAHLCFEITETALMADTRVTRGVLGRLRDLGIRLALDDFGTGYSSLSYLSELPVGMIKIDRSFVVALEQGDAVPAIVEAVTSLAHALGMRVVAEGIETEAQRNRAHALGCDWAQGYYFAKPQPAESFSELLSQPDLLPAATGRLIPFAPRGRTAV